MCFAGIPFDRASEYVAPCGAGRDVLTTKRSLEPIDVNPIRANEYMVYRRCCGAGAFYNLGSLWTTQIMKDCCTGAKL